MSSTNITQTFEHFARKTPWEILGVEATALTDDHFSKMQVMRDQLKKAANTKAGAQALETFDKAYLIMSDNKLLESYNKWAKEKAVTPTSNAAMAAVEQIASSAKEMAGKLHISNPVIALGASILVAGGLYAGVKATHHIREAKEAGNEPSAGERVKRALGFTTAAAAISAAALMWNSASKGRS